MKNAAILLLLMALVPVFAHAQQKQPPLPSRPDTYFPDFPADEAMKGELPDQTLTQRGVQFGAWITPVIISKMSSGNSLTSSDVTARAWFRMNLWPHSFLFIRGKYVRHDVIARSGSASDKISNLGDLDLGFISSSTSTKLFRATVGRKYFMIGSGLVLNNRADGVELEIITKYVKIQAIGCYSGFLLRQDNPFALSDRDISKNARRAFGGGSISVNVLNQTIYGFAVGQFDLQKDQINWKRYNGAIGFNLVQYQLTLQPWYLRQRYNSQYYGIGAYGVFGKALVYNAEAVYERGRGYATSTNKLTDVSAFAVVANLSYYFDAPTRPSLVAQYAFGSGDRNRGDYKNPNGNNFGRDHGFMAFGTYVGGYGLQPVLGNIHVIRAGFSCSPLQTTDILAIKSLSIVAKYSLYLKHRLEGAINYGLDATRRHRIIGHGADLSLRWLILSDIGLFFNYGFFCPTDAYISKSNRHFLMGGFNISI